MSGSILPEVHAVLVAAGFTMGRQHQGGGSKSDRVPARHGFDLSNIRKGTEWFVRLDYICQVDLRPGVLLTMREKLREAGFVANIGPVRDEARKLVIWVSAPAFERDQFVAAVLVELHKQAGAWIEKARQRLAPVLVALPDPPAAIVGLIGTVPMEHVARAYLEHLDQQERRPR